MGKRPWLWPANIRRQMPVRRSQQRAVRSYDVEKRKLPRMKWRLLIDQMVMMVCSSSRRISRLNICILSIRLTTRRRRKQKGSVTSTWFTMIDNSINQRCMTSTNKQTLTRRHIPFSCCLIGTWTNEIIFTDQQIRDVIRMTNEYTKTFDWCCFRTP